MFGFARMAVLVAVGTVGAVALPAGAAGAATPALSSLVAYVRDGNVYVSKGATEKRLTDGGGHARPRWSPDGRRIAFLRSGLLWTMNADGTGKRRLTTRAAAGPSWSPDGRWIAFASLGCTGGPVVYRIAASTAGATPEVLFPSDCRGEALPPEPVVAQRTGGTLTDRLRSDDAVAWSPDGTRVAFRGGQCESTYDACLTVGTIATGGERVVDAYGGGGRQNSGFAAVPAWRADGSRLSWTAYQVGETTAGNLPVHLVEYDPASGAKRTVGATEDRELAYLSATRAVVTGQYGSGSWVLVLDLGTGKRTPFHAGSQPSVQPARA